MCILRLIVLCLNRTKIGSSRCQLGDAPKFYKRFIIICDKFSKLRDVLRIVWSLWNVTGILASVPISKWYSTHWGWDKMAAISQTTFSNASPWMKMDEFRLKFYWSIFLRVQSMIFQLLVQIKARHRPGNKSLSEPMMVELQTHICFTLPQWVNTTKP